jgi:hypothetical protein
VHQLGDTFLASGLYRHSLIRLLEAEAAIASAAQIDTACLLVTLAAVTLIFSCVYAPTIRRLDADIKRARALLLLFPDAVARAVPAIVTHSRELVAGAPAAGGGSGR